MKHFLCLPTSAVQVKTLCWPESFVVLRSLIQTMHFMLKPKILVLRRRTSDVTHERHKVAAKIFSKCIHICKRLLCMPLRRRCRCRIVMYTPFDFTASHTTAKRIKHTKHETHIIGLLEALFHFSTSLFFCSCGIHECALSKTQRDHKSLSFLSISSYSRTPPHITHHKMRTIDSVKWQNWTSRNF